MDLIKQNKFIGWVIGILVAINILTLTIIWFQSDRRNSSPSKEGENPPGSSAKLMQNEIGLNNEQAKKFQEMQKNYKEKTKQVMDELDSLKLDIADEIFNSTPDEKKIDSITSRIGLLQSKIEIIRFEHFRNLVQICDKDQKEKLHPILREVFAKKGPKDKPDIKIQPEMKKDAENIRDRSDDRKPAREDGRPAPPSIEEKLNRYTERLSLSPEQIKKVENILKVARTKGEAQRTKLNPVESEIEIEKNKIRKEEDESIFQILDQNQKKEFEKMVKNRGK